MLVLCPNNFPGDLDDCSVDVQRDGAVTFEQGEFRFSLARHLSRSLRGMLALVAEADGIVAVPEQAPGEQARAFYTLQGGLDIFLTPGVESAFGISIVKGGCSEVHFDSDEAWQIVALMDACGLGGDS